MARTDSLSFTWTMLPVEAYESQGWVRFGTKKLEILNLLSVNTLYSLPARCILYRH
jgi:hypothetical protein